MKRAALFSRVFESFATTLPVLLWLHCCVTVQILPLMGAKNDALTEWAIYSVLFRVKERLFES